jgi:hypothetical protein
LSEPPLNIAVVLQKGEPISPFEQARKLMFCSELDIPWHGFQRCSFIAWRVSLSIAFRFSVSRLS